MDMTRYRQAQQWVALQQMREGAALPKQLLGCECRCDACKAKTDGHGMHHTVTLNEDSANLIKVRGGFTLDNGLRIEYVRDLDQLRLLNHYGVNC
jgi:hypothetical protein